MKFINTMNSIQKIFTIAAGGLIGVFLVLILFYILMKVLNKILPTGHNND